MIFALAGNQNSGKTTLFNALTGSNQHVGNWPGVTVERKHGLARGQTDFEIVDLPGIYSLSPYTLEERISRDFLVSDGVDGIINIVDATNIERNLYLTLQLIELGKPMVVALNMMDEVRAAGDTFDVEELRRELGLPIIPISARNGEGLDELKKAAREMVSRKAVPPLTDICSGELHAALHAIAHLVYDHAMASGLPTRYAATKLVEGDQPVACRLRLDETDMHIIGEIVSQMESRLDADGDCALADARYSYIDHLVSEHIRRSRKAGEPSRSNLADRVITHKWLAIPLFGAAMLTVFWLTFGPIGTFLADGFAQFLGWVQSQTDAALRDAGTLEWLRALTIEGVMGGVFAMLGFLPVIVILFFALSVLEDTGYMARAAFVMDRLLSKFGLSGRAFIPMIMGFGCSVPAIMATRTMSSEKERRLTILITPFMSCAARVPIYALFIFAFFEQNRPLVMMGIYAIGIAAALLCAFFLKDLPYFKAEPTPFVMELPPYRLPAARNVLRLLWDKAWDFIRRAFTVIFAASVILWFLASFDTSFQMVEDNSHSILAVIGGAISPVFEPLGFGQGNWRASTALLTGLTAKEAVVSTMAVLYQVSEDALPDTLRAVFSPLSAWSFMIFTLLYMPCAAAFAATKKELGKWRYALGTAGIQTGLAWVVSFLVYQIGRLVTHSFS